MENSTYALVLTGDVLPGYTPESVWPALAAYFRMEPAKLSGQLLARAPLTIKQSDDLGKLQTLQGGAAAIGAGTEICAPDGRANLFVVLDNAPRGPVPRVFVDERIEHGLWAGSLMVAAVGSDTWKPYRDFDAEAIAATASPAPAPVAEDMFEAMATPTGRQTAPLALMPLGGNDTDEGVFAALPPGRAIHAGFWRRCAALIIDSILVGVAIAIVQVAVGIGALGSMAGGQPDAGALVGSMFLVFALTFVGQWLYFALFESSSIQATPGKRAMGLKVVDLTGRRIGFGRASGRFFGKIISTMILDIGYMLAGWSERKQALHDMLAGTLVVFRGVQPGQPLPTLRPPMPWYGWLLNILFVAMVPIAILAAIALPAYRDYVTRTRVSTAMVAAEASKTAVAEFHVQNARCPASATEAGIEDQPHPYLGSIAVMPDCRIVMTFMGTSAVPQAIRGERIELDGQPQASGSLHWTCSGTLAPRYLPATCRS